MSTRTVPLDLHLTEACHNAPTLIPHLAFVPGTVDPELARPRKHSSAGNLSAWLAVAFLACVLFNDRLVEFGHRYGGVLLGVGLVLAPLAVIVGSMMVSHGLRVAHEMEMERLANVSQGEWVAERVRRA